MRQVETDLNAERSLFIFLIQLISSRGLGEELELVALVPHSPNVPYDSP
jgi:hypothetical protein